MISRSSSLMSSANVGRGALSRNTKVLMSPECHFLTTAGRHDGSSRKVRALANPTRPRMQASRASVVLPAPYGRRRAP